VFAQITQIWHTHATALPRRNEAFTCFTLLEPILDQLGWSRIPQQSLPQGFTTRKVPDYCLFTSNADFTAASQARDPNNLLRLSASVLEAKKYAHSLDQLPDQSVRRHQAPKPMPECGASPSLRVSIVLSL
jgi:hypothetical protein